MNRTKIIQFCLSGWNMLDPIYFRFTRLHHIKKNCGNKTIMRVRLTRYKGRDITLCDGTIIGKNDVLVKVHLHNVKLLNEIMQYKSDLRKGKVIYSRVKDSLPGVFDYIQSSSFKDEIKGLIGITTLYKGCKRLGFESYPIKNPVYKKFKKTALMPIYFLSSSKQWKPESLEPMYLFMSKATLLQRYGSH
ncbi:hypothetical protein D4T97_005685 [Siminovitchia acidinfaciens]|uniref:YkoP-like domain-containing protein n=1 Tax=Siminovitchia acidinfaciens TaxID=2321395 RepID=A0A429Y4H3_9BACI|nr:hypothetical protein [Siminovitchia acidinfaciens]RST76267.1 hypothetical protein D4T97_005685 [Siminovitchia acidinfaciens]